MRDVSFLFVTLLKDKVLFSLFILASSVRKKRKKGLLWKRDVKKERIPSISDCYSYSKPFHTHGKRALFVATE